MLKSIILYLESSSLSVFTGSKRRLTASGGLRSKGEMNFLLRAFQHRILCSSVKFPVYMHKPNKGNSPSLDAPSSLKVPMWSTWKTPFLPACAAKWKIPKEVMYASNVSLDGSRDYFSRTMSSCMIQCCLQ